MHNFIKKLAHKAKRMFKNKHLRKNMVLFSASIFILVAGLGMLFLFSMKIPDFSAFNDRKVVNSTQIYDRTGEVLLYDIHEDIKRTYIPLDQMSLNIKNATVAIEDAEFYNHSGVRVSSTLRAILSNLFNVGIGGGGSTITQQLIKNTLLTTESGYGRYVRKVKEWVLAVKIDNSMTKEEILENYLNEIPYGGSIYGIEAASKTYFSKKALDLTLAESAYLASIPQAPTTLSPYGKNRDRLESRKNLVLSRMLELGFISEDEYTRAKNEVVAFVPKADSGIKAPHFVFFIRQYLEEKYGIQAIEQGGLKVTTTIDAELQDRAEEYVKQGALENERDWNGENAALVAIDPKTGQIISMVGSRDYFDKNIDGNYNIATAKRQPGSAFKPFIYATAFNKGFTENTVLFDVPTEFSTGCSASGDPQGGRSEEDCYMPGNYDGKFRGPMSLRNALAQSINVPAVKLFYLAGMKDSLKTAEEMGITSLEDVERYGLTLVIGGGEVSLLDITSAYSVFANSGVRNPYTGVLKVEDLKGRVLEEFRPNGREVLPKKTALLISDILSDNNARVPTFGANSPLNIPGRDVAAKTGTTNSNRDAWTIGYTPNLVVGVWAGNNNNKAMKKGGAAVAGPIWNKFMTDALAVLPSETFEEPDRSDDYLKKPILRGHWQGGETFIIDNTTGGLANEFTPPEAREERSVTGGVHSILYWIDKDDIMGPAPSNPSSDPQFRNWEAAVQNWWGRNRGGFPYVPPSEIPTGIDNVPTNSSKPEVNITEPNSRTYYNASEPVSVRVSAVGANAITKMDVYVNDIYLKTLETPFAFSFIPSDLENLQEVNELKVVAHDTALNKGQDSTKFRVK